MTSDRAQADGAKAHGVSEANEVRGEAKRMLCRTLGGSNPSPPARRLLFVCFLLSVNSWRCHRVWVQYLFKLGLGEEFLL